MKHLDFSKQADKKCDKTDKPDETFRYETQAGKTTTSADNKLKLNSYYLKKINQSCKFACMQPIKKHCFVGDV